MTTTPEAVIIQHLTSTDSLDVIAREGLPVDVFPDEGVAKAVFWSVKYYLDSGKTQAPTPHSLVNEFGIDFWIEELQVDPTDDPSESVEWAIAMLRSDWIRARGQEAIVGLAQSLAIHINPSERAAAFAEEVAKTNRLVAMLDRQSQRMQTGVGVEDAIIRYNHRASLPGTVHGASLGMAEIDEHTYGINEGELAILAAGPKTGKAQPLTSPVMTPAGPVPMGSLKVGSHVLGVDGKPTQVVAVHPQGEIPVFRVTFNDGSSTEACGDHLWQVRIHGGGSIWRIKTTAEAKAILETGGKRKLIIPMAGAAQFEGVWPTSVDPYLLGVILGDGGLTGGMPTITTGDLQIVEAVTESVSGAVGVSPTKNHYTIRLLKASGVKDELVRLGLWGHKSEAKFIPRECLVAPEMDRRMLLAGLLDTDGGVEGNGRVTYSTSSPQLARDVRFLVESLGGVCRVTERQTKCLPNFILGVRLPYDSPFMLRRKNERLVASRSRMRGPHREIVEIVEIGSKPAQCITVDSHDSLYLTDHFIVTHNSFLVAWSAIAEARRGRRVMLVTMENSVEMTWDRILCMVAGVDTMVWQTGEATAQHVERIELARLEMLGWGGMIEVVRPDSGQRTVETIVSRALAFGADTLLIDQLTFLELPDPRKPKTERIGEALHTLKSLISSGRRPMSCLMAHQINREGVKMADRVGHLEMFHLADSAEIERTADWVFGMYASRDDKIAGMAKMQILASRRAPTEQWLINWHPYVGNVRVRSTFALAS